MHMPTLLGFQLRMDNNLHKFGWLSFQLLLLRKEACTLQAAVDAWADPEVES